MNDCSSINLDLYCERQTSIEPGDRILQIAMMFGLGVDESRRIIVVPQCKLILDPAQVILVTGPSGGGKSTILDLISELVPDHQILTFDTSGGSDDRPIVDQIGETLEDSVRYLALSGLSDAFVMLRNPSQLSDGQRYRFELAKLIHAAETQDTKNQLLVVIADEFGATLDRLTASVVAKNIGKWVRTTSHVCFVCATTHDDLLEPLDPDVLIYKGFGDDLAIEQRDMQRQAK